MSQLIEPAGHFAMSFAFGGVMMSSSILFLGVVRMISRIVFDCQRFALPSGLDQ